MSFFDISWDRKHDKMESRDKKQGRFPQTFKKHAHPILKTYGIIQEKYVCIAIFPTTKKNCINVDLENQLILSESDIIDNNTILSNDKYELKNLQLFVDYCKDLTQFNIVSVVSLEQDMVDIILGSAWLDTLGTFMFNTRKKFLTFPYKKKKVTYQDVTMKPSSGVVLTEDFKDISKVLSQEDQKSIQNMHNELIK